VVRNVHPRKEIEQALQYAHEAGWTIKVGGGHAWGKIYCPQNDESCRCGNFCIASIWSTPRNPEAHAKAIRRVVDNCTAITSIHPGQATDSGE
jgi:hypothetical protein